MITIVTHFESNFASLCNHLPKVIMLQSFWPCLYIYIIYIRGGAIWFNQCCTFVTLLIIRHILSYPLFWVCVYIYIYIYIYIYTYIYIYICTHIYIYIYTYTYIYIYIYISHRAKGPSTAVFLIFCVLVNIDE